MREIFLSDQAHHVRDNAFLELDAYGVYPEDEPSREQALLLISHEAERASKFGHENHVPSRLVETVLNDIKRAQGRRFTCGMVALAMCALDNAGKSMSLEKASEVVTEYNNCADKAPFMFWRKSGWLESEIILNGYVEDVKKAFRE